MRKLNGGRSQGYTSLGKWMGTLDFFRRMANARRNKNQINKITIDGRCIEDPKEIEQAFI